MKLKLYFVLKYFNFYKRDKKSILVQRVLENWLCEDGQQNKGILHLKIVCKVA